MAVGDSALCRIDNPATLTPTPAGRSAFIERQGVAVLKDDTMEGHKLGDG